MDKFKLGDKVKVVLKETNLTGNIYTIIEIKLAKSKDSNKILKVNFVDEVHDSDGIRVAFEDSDLELIYDGDEKSNWSECVWKPKEKIVG